MAEVFNPYHVWLGIPPEEQPPNHYRLLSLRLFETNGDVIDSAADRQMAHLRTFQSGKHGELTQRLLNEVAASRICLLDPKKRVAYDQQLRTKLPAAIPATPSAATPPATSGSAIHRQPPRRTGAAPAPNILAAPASAVAPQPVDPWDDLLGDPNAKPAHRPGAKSTSQGAAKRSAAKLQATNNRKMSIGIAAVVVLVAAVGIGWFAVNGSPSDGTLVFDWPAADRTDTTVSVDGTSLTIPLSGPWEYLCPAGPHHIVAQHLAFKLDTKVAAVAGQKQTVPPDWKPKAMLVLNWPLAMRSGEELTIDGHLHSMSRHDPLEVPVEPGRHQIQIARLGSAPIVATAIVKADGRELVSITPPPTTAKLVLDWPADQRKGADLTVDGRARAVTGGSDGAPIELTLAPGRHVVHITRTAFQPFDQAIELAAGTKLSVKPTWTPEPTVTTTAADTQPAVDASAQPAKKLAAPAEAEKERIAKQLDELYKLSKPGPKDPAKAQVLYDVAAKAGASPAERYMLLMKGAEIAAAAGDLNLSLQGIDTLDAEYEIDALEAKEKLLDKFVGGGKLDELESAIPLAEQLIDQAVAADRFDVAIVLATTASHAAANSQFAARKEIEERLFRRRHDIRQLETIYAATKKAQETLGKTPADPDASLNVGRWKCFYKGDWATGLPMLAKGSDEKLKSVAEQELRAPTDPEKQAELADMWWDLAQKEAGIARDSVRRHAGDIYQSALPNLASALRKAAIEKRLGEIADLKPIASSNAPIASAEPQVAAKWIPLEAKVAESAIGATLTKEPSCVVFVSGKMGKDTYTVTVRTRIHGITAFRLEALADPRLPGSGPGRGSDGNMVLSEFRVTAAPLSSPRNAQPVVLQNAQAGFSQDGWNVSAAIDGDSSTGWGLFPQLGRDHVAVFECRNDVGFSGGTVLTFTMEHFFSSGESIGISLGKFRLSASTAPRPVRLEGGP